MPATVRPRLSIIIVNWKSAGFLRRCLASIAANTTDLNPELVVIDNASYDGCQEVIEREFPAVRFMQSHENLGFAGANNLAFHHSTGRNVLFLNPDTEVVGNALQTMLAFLESSNNVATVGPKLLDSSGNVQYGCLGSFPTILNQILDAEALRERFPGSRIWGVNLSAAVREPVPVDVVPGTCLMIRRETFENAGRFSERYFMYSEDVDLCCEVRKSGLQNYVVPDAIVIHYGGSSSVSRPENHFAAVMSRESIWKFMLAKRGFWYAVSYRLTTLLAAVGRILLAGVLLVRGGTAFRRDGLRYSIRKWSRILRWTLGLESWAKDFPGPRGTPLSAATARLA